MLSLGSRAPALCPSRIGVLLAVAVVLGSFSTSRCAAAGKPERSKNMIWHQLPPIPDGEGFAGPFAGTHHGALIVAGGANFPDKRPWEGGTKVWYDHVLVLEKPTGPWRKVGKLPRPLGYGVSITTKEGVICAGGSDAAGHHNDVFRLSWTQGQLAITPLPPLPVPCANMCGALMGSTVYIAGGIETPTATKALNTLWALDLKEPGRGWKALEPIPGRERMLATAGVVGGSFYVFGGAALKAGADGKPVREWLRDAWRYTPDTGWRRVADLPRVSVAAPNPAPEEDGRLLVIGGDDGAQVDVEPTRHKGFPREVLAYDPRRDQWQSAGEVPFSLVTTASVEWRDRVVIPGGEAKPGIRSVQVWSGGER